MRILLVEDNQDLGSVVSAALQRAGLLVDIVHNLSDARAAVTAVSYSVVVLDLGLPDENGIVLVQELRCRGNVMPVLVLSARNGLQDRVTALQEGADDYLTKPFAMEELVVRLQVLLRRLSVASDPEFVVGNLRIDTTSQQIYVGGIRSTLPLREISILKLLMQNVGRVVYRDRLQLSSDGTSDATAVVVHRLRKALEEAGATVEVHTIRGVGYMLTEKSFPRASPQVGPKRRNASP